MLEFVHWDLFPVIVGPNEVRRKDLAEQSRDVAGYSLRFIGCEAGLDAASSAA
jgi:hypothetical protein